MTKVPALQVIGGNVFPHFAVPALETSQETVGTRKKIRLLYRCLQSDRILQVVQALRHSLDSTFRAIWKEGEGEKRNCVCVCVCEGVPGSPCWGRNFSANVN